MKIGHGFDAHRFAAGRRLILGGVEIQYEMGMEAHSDGDVVVHALCDALLGALGAGDIGQHFPDSDSQFKNIDSRELLRHVTDLVIEKGWQIGNADITIIAQAPKLAPFLALMRERLTDDMRTEIASLNLKATTTEKMGYIGRNEGIAVHAVVLLKAGSI